MVISTLVVLISGFILAVLSPEAQAQSYFRFVSWADTKSSTSELSELSDQAVQLDPAFSIYEGDLEDSGFTASGMNDWKEAMDGQLTGDTSPNGMFDIVFPVRGNHDDSNTAGWQAYFDFQATADFVGATNYTNMPGPEGPEDLTYEDLSYSFDYQNAHFIGVDVTGDAGGITSAQINWIDDDLTAAEARGLTHAFIYFHGPIYCVDGHCSCSERVGCIDSSVETLIEVFNQHPIVSATFHGHEHTYAYTYIDETRVPAEGSFEGVTHPFHQFITGSAGAGPASCDANRCDYNMAENGFVTVDVEGPNVTVTFYQLGSMVPVNTISYTKEGGTPSPPTANDDTAVTAEDTPVTIDVAYNDTDPNGNLDPSSAIEIAAPSNGTLVNNSDGTFTYTPNPGFTGSDNFVYEICDTDPLCDTATVSITVTPPNDPPVAHADPASTAEDSEVIVDAAGNDTDPDGNLDPTTANSSCAYGSTGCLGAANGSLSDNGDGTITYTPNADFNGTDSFVYEICDTYGLCDTATVSVTVDPVADSPVANDDPVSTIEDTPLAIDVAANDTDPDGNLDPTTTNTICFTCVEPTSGSLVNNSDGTFDYTPEPGFYGTDSFVYEICDTESNCDTATVSITVNPSTPAVVVVDAVSSGNTTGANLTISHTTSGLDRLMLVGVSINNDNSETVSSISYNGVPLTFVGAINNMRSGGDDARAEIWQLVTPSAGTHDVVITLSSAPSRGAVAGVITFTGVDQSTPLGPFASNENDPSPATVDVQSAPNELVFGVVATEYSAITTDPGQTEEWNISVSGTRTNGAGSTKAGASTVNLSWTVGGSAHWAAAGVSIKPSGIPLPNTPPSVSISAPTDGTSFTEGDTITFTGTASDTEDGYLSANLSWLSDIDGSIGSGGSFTSNTLSVGTHTITASVTDSGNLGGSDQIIISVTTAGYNLPPTVSAGPDLNISLFENATLDGSVSDDGLPDPPGMVTTTWSQVDGPGTVTFADVYAVDTTASFSQEGSYVLELSADDGELNVSDQVIITVSTASTIRVPQDYSSIQAAIDAAQNGDVVLVSPGTYNVSLTLDKAVTLASLYFTTGDEGYIGSTILDGGNRSSVINIPADTPDRPKIIGFTIQNATDGIFPSAKFDFLHNVVTQHSDGIDYEAGSGGLCKDNVFEFNGDDGIDLDGSVDIVIADNIIRNNGDDGIEIRMQSYAGPVLDIIIRNNLISGNDEDGIQIIDYSDLSDRFILIEGNLIENNAMAGLGLMDNGDTSEDYRAASIPEPIHVFNNTFSGNNHGLTGGDNLIALNNLFVNSTVLAMKNVDGDSIAAYNLFWNNATHEQGSNLDLATTLIDADPLLGAEFQLQPGSPAIDAGTSYFKWLGETVLDLSPDQFKGTAPDLGAYESDFEPGNQAPAVAITAPAGGSSFTEGDTITFTGSANDTEDGDLSANLSWVSDIDGSIGSGGSFSSSSLSVGTHTITASVTDSGDLTGSDQVTITVTVSGSVHIYDMDRIGEASGKKKWKATVILRVHDSAENPVTNGEISGTWSGGISGTSSCIIDINGECSVTSRPIPNSEMTVTFTVDNVSHATMSYDAAANHDDEGDSDGTVIGVNRP